MHLPEPGIPLFVEKPGQVEKSGQEETPGHKEKPLQRKSRPAELLQESKFR